MPWTAADAKRHKKGLTPKQARQWSHIANSQLQTCLDKGGTQEFCEGQAIRAANGSVGKSVEAEDITLILEAPISKADDSRRRLFGWASIAVRKDGQQIEDLQGDLIDIEDLEEAWYAYVAESGEVDFNHDGPVRGHLIEAMVFTPEKLEALGLPADSMPLGAWVGYEIDDDADYALVKSRGFLMFSIAGSAIREAV